MPPLVGEVAAARLSPCREDLFVPYISAVLPATNRRELDGVRFNQHTCNQLIAGSSWFLLPMREHRFLLGLPCESVHQEATTIPCAFQ